MSKIIREDFIKSILRIMRKTIICSRSSLFIIATSIIRRTLTKSLQRYLKKILVRFLTTNKLLILALFYT